MFAWRENNEISQVRTARKEAFLIKLPQDLMGKSPVFHATTAEKFLTVTECEIITEVQELVTMFSLLLY